MRFRYKAVNPEIAGEVKLTIYCRLEPMLADSYARRADFGTFVATGEWNTFDAALAEGKNLDALLKSIVEESPAHFKVVWAHGGEIQRYRAGDTLLIDDLAVTRVPAME